MSNPFKNYFSGFAGGGAAGGSDGGSRFVGNTVDMGGNRKLKVKKVIAEGGYGYVFVAQDTQTGRDYALKRQVVSKENVKVVKKEIAFLKQLGDHPHIIKYVASAGIPPSETSHGSAEFLIQTELCDGGRMESVVKSSYLNPKQVLRVFYATCSAVAHMHSLQPPVIHRDLKVENLLLDSEGVIKLCDFGSATTQQLNPDSSWSSVQRGLAEDEIQCNTTPMYRSPEMVDLYNNQLISEKADIWALGCMLYLLCFRTHPFEDSSKLRILNANYKIPEEDTTFVMFHSIIRSCLTVKPSQRPTVDAILAQLYSVSDALGENMEEPSRDLLALSKRSGSAENSAGTVRGEEDGERGSAMSSALQSTSQQAQKFFGYMKDGAGSLFKNIKESSSKAISAMSTAGPKKSGLDITYITSRIIAMSYPHDDAFHGHHISEVRAFLDERHPSAYLVFNLSGNGYDVAKLNNQVYDFAWPQRGVPAMEKLVDLCRSMDAWLRADKQNVLVVHCHDGISLTPVAIVAYLLFVQAVSSPVVGLQYVALKRRPDAPRLAGTPSQVRYLQHMGRLVGQPAFKPHPCKVTLMLLKLSTVPLFNAIRTGCKPFVEVYQEGERVYTSASADTMDSIRSFHAEDGSVSVPLGVSVQGNIVINLHHIRAIPVARKAGMGMTAVKMFYLHLHTGFLDTGTTTLTFDRKDLDGSPVRKQDKFPAPFNATLEVEWDTSKVGAYREASWQNLPYPKSSPLSCFSSITEQDEVLRQLDPRRATLSRPLPEVPPTPTSPPSDILHLQQNPNFKEEEEEHSSAGGGILFTLDDSKPPRANHTSNSQASEAGRDFFAQLDWQEHQKKVESTGYVPYQDRIPEDFDSASSSSGSSSDGSSDDEFNEFQVSPVPYTSNEKLLEDDMGGLLIGNIGSEPANKEDPAPQIKLIEFGAAEEAPGVVSNSAVPSMDPFQRQSSGGQGTKPVPYIDPFQIPSTTAPPTTQQSQSADLLGGASSDFSDVMFDPFGGLSTSELSSSKADATFGDLLGFGSDKGANPSPISAPSSEEIAGIESEGGDIFDPFGSIGDKRTANHKAKGVPDLMGEPDLMGGPPNTLAAPVNPLAGHRYSEPFMQPAAAQGQSRKYSSPTLTGPQLNQTTAQSTNTLSAGVASNVSHSHPNLFSLNGSNMHPSSTTAPRSGWSGTGGSASHNTSPHRSPSPNPMPQSSSSMGNITQHQQQQFDPFQQFNLNSMVGKTSASQPGTAPAPVNVQTSQAAKPPTGNSYQPYYMQNQSQHRNGLQQSAAAQNTANKNRAQNGAKPKPASVFRARPQSPNYNPSLFSNVGNKTGIPSKPKDSAFGDLLGSNFTSKPSNESKTLKAMQADSTIENALDPERARVAAWADKKERNIRAILGSLHEILWEGETRWKEVGMHQLVQPDQVKKYYRKACLSVHPDKLQGTAHENLARAIFDELNDAYTKFEESGARALY